MAAFIGNFNNRRTQFSRRCGYTASTRGLATASPYKNPIRSRRFRQRRSGVAVALGHLAVSPRRSSEKPANFLASLASPRS